MELVFLGTGAGLPSPCRGASCTILKRENFMWMFDCGEGSQIQLMKSKLRLGKVNRIFITHLHGDHVFGLPGLMCTLGLKDGEDSSRMVHLYGPVGLRNYVNTSLIASRSVLGYQYVVHELVFSEEQENIYQTDCSKQEEMLTWPDGGWTPQQTLQHPDEQPGTQIHVAEDGAWDVCTDDGVTVRAGFLRHKIPCFGYVIQEPARLGKLDIGALKRLGVPSGPLYGQLKNGQDVTLPDGRVVKSSEVLGPSQRGRCVVICGDSYNSEGLIPALSSQQQLLPVDVLVHEATMDDSATEKAIDYGHSTAGMTGALAKCIGAKHLILTHISQRFNFSNRKLKNKEGDVAGDELPTDVLLQQAQAAYGSEAVTIATDFYEHKVPQPT